MAATAVQSVKRVTLTGAATAVEFDRYSGKYLVKNFTQGDIYVSFENTVANDTSIRIPTGVAQVCVINERHGENGREKANAIYINGTGEVEVQQLWW